MTHYATDKLARANQLGYPDYLSALIALYCDEQLSFAQVGRYFGITWTAVRYQIKQAGMPIRGRGGDNNRLRGGDNCQQKPVF
ncbi:MAG: hypothetical protein AUJ12_00315 [Alphaproteobacteria bacterium CG1_02_46_17]|nr:MAG: hypothetical protein AUJ12_00315 [Alphaproteobacteria bacterium CG1_02_46_17]